MTTKERIIRKSIATIEKRLVSIEKIIEARPGSRIIELRKQAHEILIQYDGDYKKIAELIEPLGKDENKQLGIMKKQSGKSGTKLWNEKFKLESELNELKSELCSIERKKMIRGLVVSNPI